MLRQELDHLCRDVPLTTLALGIAAGFAILDLGRGVSSFVEGLLTNEHDSGFISARFSSGTSGGLSWQVGHRVLTFDKILSALIELAVVALAAIVVARRRTRLTPSQQGH